MTGFAPTTVKIGVMGLGYVGLPGAAGFAEINVTDIGTGNDLCEARDAGPQICKGTIRYPEPNVGPRTQADSGVFHEA